MIENPMYADYPEDDEPAFEIPGIDDCDYLYSASDGDTCIYIAVQEHPYEPGIYYANVIIDCESGSFCDDLETMAGPFETPEDACRQLAHHFDWFLDNPSGDDPQPIGYCDETAKILGPHPTT